MILSLLTIGLISLLAQVTLLRELVVAFYGIELIYILALGGWFFATALGALTARRSRLPSLRHLLTLLMLFSAILPLDVLFIRAIHLLFAGVPGAYLTFPQQVAAMTLAVLPVGLLSGLLFQWAAKQFVAEGRTLAAAYAIESAGSLAGGLLATACFHWGVQNFTTLLLCALAALVPSALLSGRQNLRGVGAGAIGLALVLLILLGNAAPLDRLMTSWTHPGLLESRDSPYGRITVRASGGQVAVFENNALAFETEGTEAEAFVHPAALQHPQPKRVLVLGGGLEGALPELLKHHPERIDHVELNSVLVEAVVPHLSESVRDIPKQSNVQMILADPRQFLQHSGRYDLILVGMPEPSSGQANRFYTREFFAQCATRLNPQGILAFRLRSAENYWTPQLTRRTGSIYRALADIFPHILVLPGPTNVITASASPLTAMPEILVERLRDREIQTRLATPPYLHYLFENDRFVTVRQRLQASAAPANTDVRPVCYLYATMVWLSKFFPQSALPDLAASTDQHRSAPPLWWSAVPVLALLFLLCRRRPRWRAVILVALAGFLGMVLETVLLLHYQAKHGVLFRDIGLLLTLFMAGLALGAATANAVLDRVGGGQNRIRRWNAGFLAGFVALCLVTAGIIGAGGAMGPARTAGWLAVAGFLVAGLFGAVSLQNRREAVQMISPLYAADLIGGCAGSLLAGLILIPLLGLDVTLQGLLGLALLALLLV
jgi:spermidine synthase